MSMDGQARPGQPTKYRPEYCQMLIDHMAKGFSYETFGATIGVARATVFNWEKDNPQFLDAKKNAFDLCQIFWEKIGIDHIVSVSKNVRQGNVSKSVTKNLNTGAWIFNMKNRFKWTDRVEVEQIGTQNPIVQLAYSMPEKAE